MNKYDVAIAGGGVVGCAIALELAEAGLSVVVFDKQKPGKEASWASAGILSPAPENPGMIPLVPISKASMALYPEFVKHVEEISGQNVGFRPKGTVQALFSSQAREEMSTIVALHHGLGLRAEAMSTEEARKLEPGLSEDMEAAILRPDEASVDNRALSTALLEAAKRKGVRVHGERCVKALRVRNKRCEGLVVDGDEIEAKHTVVAAGCFSAQIAGAEDYANVLPAKGQMVSLRHDSLKIERVLWSENIYLVPRNDGRVLAGATVERIGFEKTVTAGGIEENLRGALELVPALKDAQIEETWAGLRPDTPDHLPILGPVDVEGLLFATGHFRSGIVLLPITAKLIGEWVAGRTPSVDCDRFSPMRFLEAAARKTKASAH